MSWLDIYILFLLWASQQLQHAVCNSCSVTINDELWSKQWYLNKSNTNKYDMNVIPAWRRCINGTGITVAVVDTGVQDHVDLNINRDEEFGNLNEGSASSLKHGTRIAGIIAAKKNTNFTIGIAFASQIVGQYKYLPTIQDIKVASSSVFDDFDPSALSYQKEIVDVYSCSFANYHSGVNIYPLLEAQENALKEGVTQGRNGKGSVYVFATGNSGAVDRLFRDSCAYDGLITNRYVIAVAGIQYDLSKVPNGEACSNIMVAAFTAKAGAKSHKLVTLDIGNTSTEYFNQNSAAVPMVSGAVALALHANPRLTYRDVMHLLVRTSRNDFQEFRSQHFIKNSANFSASTIFGFGLLDMGELVNQSLSWINVPPQMQCSVSCIGSSSVLLNDLEYYIFLKSCDVDYIEHVEVTLNINADNAGQLQWDLFSPYGTQSTILPGREHDPVKLMNITVVTVGMWGENPEGMWQLRPHHAFNGSIGTGSLTYIKITIYGYECQDGFKCLLPKKPESGKEIEENCTFSNKNDEVNSNESTEKPPKSTEKPPEPNGNMYLLFLLILLLPVGVGFYVCSKKTSYLRVRKTEENIPV